MDKQIQILTEKLSKKERAEKIYQWFHKNSAYDYNKKSIETQYYEQNRAYNVFINKNGVCCGFARLANIMFRLVHVPSLSVLSKTHQFNAIFIEDNDSINKGAYIDVTLGLNKKILKSHSSIRLYDAPNYMRYFPTSNNRSIEESNADFAIKRDHFICVFHIRDGISKNYYTKYSNRFFQSIHPIVKINSKNFFLRNLCLPRKAQDFFKDYNLTNILSHAFFVNGNNRALIETIHIPKGFRLAYSYHCKKNYIGYTPKIVVNKMNTEYNPYFVDSGLEVKFSNSKIIYISRVVNEINELHILRLDTVYALNITKKLSNKFKPHFAKYIKNLKTITID